MAFVISGALAGIAGVLWAARYGTIDSTAGTGYELTVVTAVVVGGVAIFGGSGSVVGAALGALLLNTINSALYVLGISAFWDQAIAGFLLITAITIDQVIKVPADRGLAPEVASWSLTSRPRRLRPRLPERVPKEAPRRRPAGRGRVRGG